MPVRIFQVQYSDDIDGEFDPSFTPYDCRHNPEPDRREVAHMARFYREEVHGRERGDGDLFGLVSPKFGRKAKIAGSGFISHVERAPGYDVYFINPFPQLAYFHFNVWTQGEYWHPGLGELADRLFAGAGFDLSVRELPRNAAASLLYCNYWVGNAKFWARFIDFSERLMDAVEHLAARDRKRLFNLAPHYAPATYFAFVFERIFSTFLVTNSDLRAMPYVYSNAEILARCESPLERALLDEWRGVIDACDAAGRADPAYRRLFAEIEATLRHAAGAGRPGVFGRTTLWLARLLQKARL
jgi:hypothetical protein